MNLSYKWLGWGSGDEDIIGYETFRGKGAI